ncbi:MAG TPA: hypothetical protein PLG21_08065 [Anaerolineae bacterium]|nr:hypothetical protein [Anaerolineae bacterium]
MATACALPAATAPPVATPDAAWQPETPTPTPAAQPRATMPAMQGPLAQVLFERGSELWGLCLPANERQPVVQGLQGASSFGVGDPWALAPNGRYLALARNGDGQVTLALAALPGGQLQEVGRYAGRIEALRWSHDSTRVACVVNRRDVRTGDLQEASLHLYDVVGWRDTVPYRQAFEGPDTVRQELWLEGWVPGDQALYVAIAGDRTADAGMLYALNARGGEPRLVSADYALKGGQAVSAASARVLLRARAARGRAAPLFVAGVAPDGSLSDIQPLSPDDWTVGAVAWSPDGQQVAAERLETQAHGTYAVHLWLLAPDGAEPRQLTGDPIFREEQPVWTPDGQAIVFGRWRTERPEPAGLWTLHLPAAELELLDESGLRAQAVAGEGR